MDVKIIGVEEFEQQKADLINAVREELAKANVSGVDADEYQIKVVCETLCISSRQFQKYRDQRRIVFSQRH